MRSLTTGDRRNVMKSKFLSLFFIMCMIFILGCTHEKNVVKKDIQDNEDQGNILKCYRVDKLLWDKEQTVVMYKSDALYDGLLLGLENDLSKINIELEKLNESAKKGFFKKKGKQSPWTYELLEHKIEEIVTIKLS